MAKNKIRVPPFHEPTTVGKQYPPTFADRDEGTHKLSVFTQQYALGSATTGARSAWGGGARRAGGETPCPEEAHTHPYLENDENSGFLLLGA